MNHESAKLREADGIEIITLVDNYADALLGTTEIMSRPSLAKEGVIQANTLLAEHGLALLVKIHKGAEEHVVLFDTGFSPIGLLHNMDYLDIDPEQIETIVLSHGHMDHTGALYSLLDRLPKPIPLVVHPDVFLPNRYIETEDGQKLLFPEPPHREALEKRGLKVVENRGPMPIAADLALITGEVARKTSFEQGLPNAMVERNGRTEKDPIMDDQALVLKIRNKGLVVISGCSHSGVINTIYYARELTGVQKIYGVLGGFHLAGPFFEQIIENTIDELKIVDPEVIVPMHCTGWKAIQRFSDEFPASCQLNSVGSKIIL
ncbi:MBL fold metallo-hydrolase [Thermodesulfobacteriota bacterium]